MSEEKILKMTFDPATIEHLGVKMYSRLPNALAELIANAYDADAKKVSILLFDRKEKSIIIDDDGAGMNFSDINDLFLRIGRNRRKDGHELSPSGKRKVTGKKGLGKLAFFGIANTIVIETIQKNSGTLIKFTLDWNELISTKDRDYKPKFSVKKCGKNLHGTKIFLNSINRKSTFDKKSLAISISKLFNLFDKTFKVTISRNNDSPISIDDKLKFENLNIQFEWKYEDLVKNFEVQYDHSDKISGKIFSSPKPLSPELRGIILFANKRLVNSPEFFGISESSHGYSYFTGWLEVDFVDDWSDDVI